MAGYEAGPGCRSHEDVSITDSAGMCAHCHNEVDFSSPHSLTTNMSLYW